MMNAYNAPESLHIEAQDGEGNKRTIRYIREDVLDKFVYDTMDRLAAIKKKVDKPEPYKEESR